MENLEGSIFTWSFRWLYVTVATVLMLLWPLKMLSINFCNVLDWTGPYSTGTIVDLPDTMVDLPDTMVDLPDTMVDLPGIMVGLPDTILDIPVTMEVKTYFSW